MNLYEKYGSFKKDNGYSFITYAPDADNVFLIINNEKHLMKKEKDGWTIFVKGVKTNTPYSFLIEKDNVKFEKSDPFARKVVTLAPKHLQSFTLESNYIWKHKKINKKNNIKVCEVFVETLEGKTYKEKIEHLLTYLKDKNYTHVQLMPIYHFSETITLGYQSSSYFSPSTKYGDINDFKFFVDKLHENNIGVIMDFVLFEFGTEELGLNNYDGNYLFNKNKNEKHAIFGGYLFDFNKQFVKDFLLSSLLYFIKEYNVDGFRFDAINEIIFTDINNSIINQEDLNNLKYIFNNLPKDCLIIAENISALNYDVLGLDTVDYVENSNYMYQIDYMFRLREEERFKRKEFLLLKEHNVRFNSNKNLIASLTHDLFLDGYTIKKDIKSLIAEDYKIEKQKLKFGLIYATSGHKVIFKDHDIGFENQGLDDFITLFSKIYDENIEKDYLEFQINQYEKVIIYSYFYKNKTVTFIFNTGNTAGTVTDVEKVLLKDTRIEVKGTEVFVQPYSYLVFENKENKI
jgi:1,4-alpha-glucan branching enzyme